ncbi:hypothetical protein GPECTOR_98g785 [Gonium pectorale]|uniref:MIF4G domain-containing protein n=1 Tax=Gonium pectorale TaxID=33097 RepID=A0A150G054_GONPE|nr:hypothetical protein GPECTOR_98g785 [Gonium pectorale]|eukprot:KXZ43201.1 hypothetical protein GPECTOR_98g785 [Gonium pectorale]
MELAGQIGLLQAEDPEEGKKQKTFTRILNKLTPNNYERLKLQILAVPIKQQRTLEGLVIQVFDQALMKTTFSEMYANLCKEIHPLLPTFPSTMTVDDPATGAQRTLQKNVDFRRLLLNKCQWEFADGNVAMKEDAEKEGVAAKERAPASEDGKRTAAGEGGKLEEEEEAEISATAATASPATTAAQQGASAKAQAEAAKVARQQLEARRRARALGTMQFIGNL